MKKWMSLFAVLSLTMATALFAGGEDVEIVDDEECCPSEETCEAETYAFEDETGTEDLIETPSAEKKLNPKHLC